MRPTTTPTRYGGTFPSVQTALSAELQYFLKDVPKEPIDPHGTNPVETWDKELKK